MKKYLQITIISIFVFSTQFSFSQEKTIFPSEIVEATQKADSKALSNFFNGKIELIIPGKSGVYSKAQAEQVLKNFFSKHPITSFQIIHQGIKDNSSFAIGRYVSKNVAYRFYYRIKETDGKTLIHQLWIENQDE